MPAARLLAALAARGCGCLPQLALANVAGSDCLSSGEQFDLSRSSGRCLSTPLRKLLEHRYLNTTQVYARIYDETLLERFKTAMSRLEAIAVDDWPGVDVGKPALAEIWTERSA